MLGKKQSKNQEKAKKKQSKNKEKAKKKSVWRNDDLFKVGDDVGNNY